MANNPTQLDELGPIDVAALMEALDRAHHRAAVECDVVAGVVS